MGRVTNAVLDYMDSMIGSRYSQSNRMGSRSFDCSSLVYRAFRHAGVTLKTSSGAVVTTSRSIPNAVGFTRVGSLSATIPGDLIFYARGGRNFHVATVNRRGGIIHARNPSKGVCNDAKSYMSGSISSIMRYNEPRTGSGGATPQSSASKPISKVVTKYSGTAPAKAVPPALISYNITKTQEEDVEVLTQNGTQIYSPVLVDGLSWESEREGAPGKLSFKIIPDKQLILREGNAVRMRYKGKRIFFGFIFTRKENKDGTLDITAYDQLRYFKNKDTYVYKNRTATQVIQMLAADYRMNPGPMLDTKYVIASRVEDNSTLLDIAKNALDETLTKTKKMYVLYDDFGRLILNDVEKMKVPIVITGDIAGDFSYSTSIDSDVYNQVKLIYDDTEKGVREVYIARSGRSINKWGLLQYFEKLNDKKGIEQKANAMLKLHNQTKREFSIKNIKGNTGVRAGSSVAVQMELNDKKVSNWLLVEKAKHTIENGTHTMDLTLRGGGIY